MSKPRYEDVRRICARCGKEITGPFGTYRYGLYAGMICYDCDAEVTEENRRRRQAVNAKRKARTAKQISRDPISRKVRKLYVDGMKPTQIAHQLGIDTAQVYQKLEEDM